MEKIYDVAIIGAGPAGSTLAYRLAQEKLKVILVDKEKFPREKVCAGGLTAKIFKVLPFDIKPVIEKEIFSLRLVYKKQEDFCKKYHQPLIYTVKRSRFDDFLAQKAKKAGACFLEQNEIKKISRKEKFYQIKTKHKSFKAKVIVGADGTNSFVAKFIDFKTNSIDIGLQFDIPYQESQNNQTLVLGWGWIPYGYTWVFPNNQFLATGVSGSKDLAQKLKSYLKDWVDFLGLTKENLSLKGHPMIHYLGKSHLFKDKIILIGDAGGLNDPLTGEGIFYALKSAEIASRHIKNFFLGNKNAFKNYEKEINKEILPELKAADFFRKVSPLFFPLVFRQIKTNNYYWSVLCRLIRGEKTFLEIKKQLKPLGLIKKIYEIKRETSRFAKSPHYT